MNRLNELQDKTDLRVGYVMPGYPSWDESTAMALHLIDLGIDVLEIGVPFSDPVADGPIIREASEAALRAGVDIKACLDFILQLRKQRPSATLVLMSYLNPLLHYGLDALEKNFAGVIDGIIVPDCPHEEMPLLRQSLQAIYPIALIAATTSDKRLEAIGAVAEGFIYLVSVNGTTGGKTATLSDVEALYKRMRPHTALPIIAGFGIQTQAQAESISTVADGCVIASAALALYARGEMQALDTLFARSRG